MQTHGQKKAEWEKLLFSSAPVTSDLPDELRELLERLDDQLGVKREKKQC
jgi:hypothetical protein